MKKNNRLNEKIVKDTIICYGSLTFFQLIPNWTKISPPRDKFVSSAAIQIVLHANDIFCLFSTGPQFQTKEGKKDRFSDGKKTTKFSNKKVKVSNLKSVNGKESI